jgi:hypothetical protein
MEPIVTKVLKRQQGSHDTMSNWAIANYRWSVQVLLRMGVLEVKDIPKDLYDKDKDGDLPNCFNPEKLTPIDIKSMAYWDETHKRQKLGKIRNGGNFEYRFKRDEHGNVASTRQYGERNTQYQMK